MSADSTGPALTLTAPEPADPADIEGVRRTLACYALLVDQGRFEEFARCFAPDAVMEVPGEVFRGREQIRAKVTEMQPPERRGQHVTVNSVIDVRGDQAEAVSNFVFFARTSQGIRPLLMGRYEDRLARSEEGWQFTARRVVMAPPKAAPAAAPASAGDRAAG